MPFFFQFKSTVLWLSCIFLACAQTPKPKVVETDELVLLGAERTEVYLPWLQGKRVAIVANQTSIIPNNDHQIHLVDSLLGLEVDIISVFAPEHGFRGQSDAGEKVSDGVDTETGLPIISLYGQNRKPNKEQLTDIDVVVFDIQDVGVRFYTYIATLQLVMEACAEIGIPVIVLDRPNPNAHYIDGPTMEEEHSSFLGMNPIPLVYGMTIGEYASMVNGEGWLSKGLAVDLKVVPLLHYDHDTEYALPVRPSPNLPNSKAINLYPSLGLFEGTAVNAGRGTEWQFQRFGASFLDSTHFDFRYVPQPNFGAKYPKEEANTCFGKDLSKHPKMQSVSLTWLIEAYTHSTDREKVFKTEGFTKHAGTTRLQQQIESGMSEEAIRVTWQQDLEDFKKIRSKYLLYE
ncbi:MAG: DUF1343 domain-containing protein [Flavobacteriaceae bacterium]|nr:DUF1343 domain-containing protein [Flavobacteriaceae bacterium]